MSKVTGQKGVEVALIAGPADGLEEGQAKAVISTYDHVDSDNERIRKGEFDGFVKQMQDTGDTVPMLFAHDSRTLDGFIGEVISFDTEAKNSKGEPGLGVLVQYDLDDPAGQKAYKLAKGRRVKEWSYRWTGERNKAADGAYDLTNLAISEVSMVHKGASVNTETLAIKGEGDKADPFAGVSALLNQETLNLIGELEPEDQARLAVQIADYCRYKGEKPAESAEKSLSVVETKLRLAELAAV